MQDRVPTPGQEGRVLITPETGSPYYAKIEMADNPTQVGTPLNKATLLKDATAALYGLTNTVVPDDVLVKLANAAFTENGSLTDVGGNSVGVQIATGSYVGTGTHGANNPSSITFGFKPLLVIVQAKGQTSTSNDNNDDPHGWGLMITCLLTTKFTRHLGMGYTGSLHGGNLGADYGKMDGTTVSWYTLASALGQLNASGVTYQYFALGVPA